MSSRKYVSLCCTKMSVFSFLTHSQKSEYRCVTPSCVTPFHTTIKKYKFLASNAHLHTKNVDRTISTHSSSFYLSLPSSICQQHFYLYEFSWVAEVELLLPSATNDTIHQYVSYENDTSSSCSNPLHFIFSYN